MARTYKRDSRGRFAGGGGSSRRGGGRKPMQRGTNRLTRDNAGRITSVGGDGATARGGRLRTASGKQRATVTAKGIGKAPAGTVGRSGKVKGAARVKVSGRRGDTAAVNIPMRGSRGRALDREISRNVTQQRTQARASDRARNRQFKTEQSRAKALRTVHVDSIAKAKGLTKSQVESALKAQSPAVQIKALKSWVRDNRKTARMAANAARTQKPAAAKPAATAKPARVAAKAAAASARPQASASQLGSRLNPAKKSIRAAKRKADKAYARENRIRSSLFSGNKSLQVRTAIEKELNKASNLTATKLQQVREVGSQFPVQTRDTARRAVGSRRAGTISQTKEVRNAASRREAFKRRVTRAASISRPGSDKKARQSARTRAQAMATYQGARRPSEADRTVGQFGRGRVSTAFKAPSSRIAAPSRSARRQGRAMALAQTPVRDQFGRRIGNPVKQQRKRSTGRRAAEFYQNPAAAARKLIQDRGRRGLPVRGFRQPRPRR